MFHLLIVTKNSFFTPHKPPMIPQAIAIKSAIFALSGGLVLHYYWFIYSLNHQAAWEKGCVENQCKSHIVSHGMCVQSRQWIVCCAFTPHIFDWNHWKQRAFNVAYQKNKQVMEPLYAFDLKSLLSPNAREKRLLRNAHHRWWASKGIHFNFASYYVEIVCGQPLIRLLLQSEPQYWWSNHSLGPVFVLQMTKQQPKQKCLHLIT